MAHSKFTLIGCYQFFNNAGDDLFKNMVLPDGINKDTLTSNILLQGGEFEVQNADPFFIQGAIQIWSNVYQETFTRWVEALAIEYAPLENYDRHEQWHDSLDGTGTSRSTGSVDNTTHDTVETTKSAYDSSSYQPYDKVETNGTSDTDTTDSTDTTVDNDTEHTGRIHGNIGVTTSQQMLTAELDLGYWNLYQRITQLFLQEFVIPVYE